MPAMRSLPAVLLACAALTALSPTAALAQGASETRLREALRTTTSQLRAAEEERSKLQASEAALKRELQAAQAQLGAAAKPKVNTRALEDANRRLAEATRQGTAQADAAREAGAALAECQAAGQDASRSRETLQGEVAALRRQLTAAEAKNAGMYRVGQEIIDWLSRLGFGAALGAREPFLGLKRVELENAAQDYQDKLLEQRLAPGAAGR